MSKPENPYRKGSVIWSIMEGDWTDLTVDQIAEVLDCDSAIISRGIYRIKKETSYSVPYVKKKGGRPPKNSLRCQPGPILG